MSKITTHVLDLSRGLPAVGMRIVCWRDEQQLRTATTNTEGRLGEPLVNAGEVVSGRYRLDFYVGDYFAAMDDPDAKAFLDVVSIAFMVNEVLRPYHVPLLVTPWSYSTYRGS